MVPSGLRISGTTPLFFFEEATVNGWCWTYFIILIDEFPRIL
jgi:hypothetical protein